MGRRKISIEDLKNQISNLQEQLEREEQKVNCEIGAWVRAKTKVENLKEFQSNFAIVPNKNNNQTDKTEENITQKVFSENDKENEAEKLPF